MSLRRVLNDVERLLISPDSDYMPNGNPVNQHLGTMFLTNPEYFAKYISLTVNGQIDAYSPFYKDFTCYKRVMDDQEIQI